LQQKLTPSDGTNQNDFGSSVAIQGDTIFVGAPARTIGFNAQQGKVYVFKRNGAVWTEQQSLIAGDGGNLDRFGDSVALDGDYAIIGASEDTLKGSAYIFRMLVAIGPSSRKLLLQTETTATTLVSMFRSAEIR